MDMQSGIVVLSTMLQAGNVGYRILGLGDCYPDSGAWKCMPACWIRYCGGGLWSRP
jgi:hypothetical protein